MLNFRFAGRGLFDDQGKTKGELIMHRFELQLSLQNVKVIGTSCSAVKHCIEAFGDSNAVNTMIKDLAMFEGRSLTLAVYTPATLEIERL